MNVVLFVFNSCLGNLLFTIRSSTFSFNEFHKTQTKIFRSNYITLINNCNDKTKVDIPPKLNVIKTFKLRQTQQTFICLKSTKEILERDAKFVQS